MERPQHPFGRPDGMPDMPVRMSAKERAVQRTDKMDKAVNLDEKQYKKIYKIFLKEEKFKKILTPEQYSILRKHRPAS
jgi:hypothetical protein